MLAGLTGFHLIVIVAAVVLLFGATKLPIFAKSLGQTVKIFRSELRPGADAAPVPAEPVATTAP
jgi:sec-independent protein translocase protein TatA